MRLNRARVWSIGLTLVFIISLLLGIWTEQTQHRQMQELQRRLDLEQLTAAIRSLQRDQPQALQGVIEPAMIGKRTQKVYCPSLQGEISIDPQLSSVIAPYLSQTPYDSAFVGTGGSGWYLQTSPEEITIASCATPKQEARIPR